jgi:hypothetical protein
MRDRPTRRGRRVRECSTPLARRSCRAAALLRREGLPWQPDPRAEATLIWRPFLWWSVVVHGSAVCASIESQREAALSSVWAQDSWLEAVPSHSRPLPALRALRRASTRQQPLTRRSPTSRETPRGMAAVCRSTFAGLSRPSGLRGPWDEPARFSPGWYQSSRCADNQSDV